MSAISAYIVFKNDLGITVYIGVNSLFVNVFNHISGFFMYKASFNTSIPIFDKYKYEKTEKQNSINTNIKFNSIELKNVSFKYNENGENYVLENKNIVFKYPQKYFILGESGSGKSTLVKLIQGLYKVNEGSVLVDDVDIQNITNEQIRNNIGYLSQDVYLFNESIKDNITLWEDYDDQKIIEVLKICRIYDYVKSLPDGLDTMIYENGKNISGGQKQRIALARLLIRDLKFIIIDEGTSQLDKENAKQIESILLSLNVSVIIITHNFNEDISDNINIINLSTN